MYRVHRFIKAIEFLFCFFFFIFFLLIADLTRNFSGAERTGRRSVSRIGAGFHGMERDKFLSTDEDGIEGVVLLATIECFILRQNNNDNGHRATLRVSYPFDVETVNVLAGRMTTLANL